MTGAGSASTFTLSSSSTSKQYLNVGRHLGFVCQQRSIRLFLVWIMKNYIEKFKQEIKKLTFHRGNS